MEILKRLIAISSLVFVLGATCFADGSSCSQDPGQTSTPPCPLAYTISDSTDPGEVPSVSATNRVDIVAIGELAIGTLLNLL